MPTNVAVTGAHGTVGTALRDQLGDDDAYAFTWIDAVDHPDVETVVADMRDAAALRAAFGGQDAVVHLALNPDLNHTVTDVSWAPELAENLRGTVAAFGAAVDAGVDSLVFASSNHVQGVHERDGAPAVYDPDHDLTVGREDPLRPDSMYGVAKVFGEALGRFCADYHGLRVYALRICNVAPVGMDTPAEYAAHLRAEGLDPDDSEFRERMARKAAMWLSHRDLARLVARCLADETVDFDVFYGVSDSDARWFDVDHAREVLGYEPRDSAEEWDVVADLRK